MTLESRMTARLSPLMREALTASAQAGGIQRRCPINGTAEWPHSPQTIHALIRRGLIEEYVHVDVRQGVTVEQWDITGAGREALKPKPVKPPKDVTLYLAPGGGYTQDAGRSVDFEVLTVVGQDGVSRPRRVAVYAVDPARLHPEWVRRAGVRWAKAQDPRVRASAVARGLRAGHWL